ncbi:hypothetical protein [Rugamonas sp.]|uniref:hypothetical protein n=1 Tax=Rugamonas sp. TaxID=1926287 RepID=UPI0025D8670A|nr:hypothetical protein [Rugamonas sp.]
MHLFIYAYWPSLTDLPRPARRRFLAGKTKAGLMLTGAIITSDVVLNAWIGAQCGFQVGAFVA